MPCTRLSLSALLLCSLSAFAQNQWGERPPHVFFREGDLQSAATPSEPWRIVPNQPPNLNSAPDARAEWRIDDFKAFRGRRLGDDAEQLLSKSLETLAAQDGLERDTTCYTIRSYVVARDSKDSDATHAAGYSTCQPSTRFRLKSTVEQLRIPAK